MADAPLPPYSGSLFIMPGKPSGSVRIHSQLAWRIPRSGTPNGMPRPGGGRRRL